MQVHKQASFWVKNGDSKALKEMIQKGDIPSGEVEHNTLLVEAIGRTSVTPGCAECAMVLVGCDEYMKTLNLAQVSIAVVISVSKKYFELASLLLEYEIRKSGEQRGCGSLRNGLVLLGDAEGLYKEELKKRILSKEVNEMPLYMKSLLPSIGYGSL